MNKMEIFCLNCGISNEIMQFFENEGITLDELDNPPIRIIGYKEDGKYTCSLCDNDLELEDYFTDSKVDYEEFIKKSVKRIGELLSTKVENCNKCPDGEILESFHATMNKEDGTNNYTGTTFWDYLGDYGIYDSSLKEKVLKQIHCSSCGYGAIYEKDDQRMFELDDKVISKQEINDFFGDDYGLDIEKLNNVAMNYGIELTSNEIEDFIIQISENPMLAYLQKTGMKLYHLFKEILKNDNVYILEIGTKIYRGRNRKKDEDKFSPNQLWCPPVGNAGHGRYNLIGIPVLYCSDTTNGIPYELNPVSNDYIDIGTFQIHKPFKLLDITEIFNEEFGEYIGSINYESKKLKMGYLFTNFIKDCCASLGFNGIRYSGVGKGDYSNYALFNYKQTIDIEVLEDVNTFDLDINYSTRKVDL
jgi:hypothetical protein